MLDNNEINIINQALKEGFDVEIQHRKNGLVILKSTKEVCLRNQDKKTDKKSPSGEKPIQLNNCCT